MLCLKTVSIVTAIMLSNGILSDESIVTKTVTVPVQEEYVSTSIQLQRDINEVIIGKISKTEIVQCGTIVEMNTASELTINK